jgi:hypothetical protein
MKLIFTFRTIHYSWIYTEDHLVRGKFQYAMGDKIMWLPLNALRAKEYESKHRPKRLDETNISKI